MADIRCSNCGKDNPDFLDVCQFCQTPLQPEALHIGDSPTKKNTGELEGILPAWLQDARKQGRESSDAEDAMETEISSKVKKDAAPDLLAGLANQSSDDDEVPDWLAGLNPVEEKKSSVSPASKDLSPSDFFAQFEQDSSQPATPAVEPMQEETPSWLGNETPASEQKDELGDWLSRTSDQPSDLSPFDFGSLQNDEEKPPAQEPKQEEPEDLSWLHTLEASSKQPEPSNPQTDMGWASSFDSQPLNQSSDSQEDLGWLNNLGGMSLPASDTPASSTAPSPAQGEDMDWLNNLGGETAPTFDIPASSKPVPSQGEDLSWLKNLGGDAGSSDEPETPTLLPSSSQQDLSWLQDFGDDTAPAKPASVQPESTQDDMSWLKEFGGAQAPAFEEKAPSQPVSSQDDLGWLNNLGAETTEPTSAQPVSQQNDMDWLSNLGGTSVTNEAPTIQPFPDQNSMGWLNDQEEQQKTSPDQSVSPFSSQTGPLAGITDDMNPDWLQSATEEPSMPAPGAVSMDWFKSQDEQPSLSTPEPASAQPNIPPSNNAISSISSQDVDSMFSVEMPDWLSQRPVESGESPSQPVATSTPGNESLAPVELPSWVQAMRPVEAALSEATADTTGQMTEKEGPLAGFSGLIPSAPIGSSRRPKAISLKLLATEEQQSNAVLLEQIIASETITHAIKSSTGVAPQKILRGALTLLFLSVLGIVIGLNSQFMRIGVPFNARELSDLIATIPDGSPVLVVMDYQPSLVGELEAASGPLLDQMALSRHAQFTFLSTSPNGSALVEHLMSNTKISRPATDNDGGLGYQLGIQYFNIGYLPGDSVGILEFVENPKMTISSVNVDAFSQFHAVVLLTDHAEAGRVWVEQLEYAKQNDPALASQILLVVSSAQSGPLLEPYVSSGQVNAMINGLSEAAGYEYVNTTRPGIARSYWDAFGVGLMMAVLLILVGSLWSLVTGIRARRAETGQG